jgi:hypothetical protein
VALRAAVALAALALAVVPAWRQRQLVNRQEQMTAWLERHGVPVPREMEYEPDPGRVVLRATRASLAAEFDPSRRSDLPAAEEARLRTDAVARLAETADLAAHVFAQRPAAWDAAMVMGTATYLSWSQAHDTRVFTAAGLWEEPLETAIVLAPGVADASRLLAGAYLELWTQLSPAKRARERQLLERALADPAAFSGLLGQWLATAGSREEAFAVMPAAPAAWEKLQQLYAERADWPGFCAARERWDLALQAHLSSELQQAEERRASAEARDLFLSVATAARPGRRYLGLLTRALEGCPPGSLDRQRAEKLVRHLAWSLERCRVDRCPLTPAALRRLAGFCRDLDPRLDAMAALVTDDLPRAEILERTYATAWTEDWAAYRLLKAKVQIEHGHGAEAAAETEAALAALPRSWLSHPSYWQVKAAAAHAAAEPAAEAAAGRELVQLAAREWPATAWDFQSGVAHLELLAATDAAGLALTIDVAPPRGAAVEVRLDESILGTFPAAARGRLVLAVPVTAGLHLLEVESVAGGPVLPGAVLLDGNGSRGGRESNGSGGEAR